MSHVITNPTPKARFQESVDNVKKHRDLVQLREFERACDFALLQYQANLSKVPLNEASATHFRLIGASEFIQVLRNLSESAELPTRVMQSENLDHRA